MKRRKLLAGIRNTAIGLPMFSATSSAFGKPNSIRGPEAEQVSHFQNILRLSLGRANVPVEIWNDIADVADLWQSLITNAEAAREFRKDPEVFLRRRGVPTSLLNADDTEVKILKACLDAEVLRTAAKGDYFGFLLRLEQTGALDKSAESRFRQKLVHVFNDQRESLIQQLVEFGVHKKEEIERSLNQDDLQALKKMVIDGKLSTYEDLYMKTSPVAVAAFAVAVAVVVVTATHIATSIAVYVEIEVEVDGPDDDDDDDKKSRKANRKLLASLEPGLLKNAEVKIKVANLMGNGNFVHEAYRDLFRSEVSAICEAAEQAGLFKVDSSVRDEFQASVYSIVSSAAGLKKAEV